MAKRATLVEVARLAGVSATSASYVLNGQAQAMRISDEAALRVKDAAATLGYRPNLTARSLRTTQSTSIGVLSDFVVSGAYASPMLSGAAHAARARDYVLIMGETEGDRDLEARLIEEFLDRGVRQFLYLTLSTSTVAVPEGLRNHEVVLLNCEDPSGDFPSVIPDDYRAGRLAARTLIDAGHSQGVVVVGGEFAPDSLPGTRRLAGIRDELAEVGGSIGASVECDWAVPDAFAAFDRALSDGLKPQSVICLNDRIALGVYQAMDEHGLSAPDIALVSFDGSEMAGWLRPALTSVVLPYEELGAAAVGHLLDKNGGQLKLECPLMRGGSVATHV